MTLAGSHEFMERGPLPAPGMAYHSSPHHVQIDIGKATPQVIPDFHPSRVETILPECPISCSATSKRLGVLTLDQLHKPADIVAVAGPSLEQQMDMIGGDCEARAVFLAQNRVPRTRFNREIDAKAFALKT